MVNVRHITNALVFIAVMFLLSTGANAVEYRLNIAQYVTAWGTKAAACASFIGLQPSSQTNFVITSNDPSCSYTFSGGSRTFDYESRAVFCTPPQILNVDGVGCHSPAPVPVPNSLIDSMNAAGQPIQYSGSPSLSACFQGSTIRGSGAACGGAASPGVDNCTLMPPFKDTGVPCTGSGGGGTGTPPVPNTEPPLGTPSNCGAGLVPGQVNGVGVCLKPSTGNTIKSETTSGTSSTTNPDGTAGTPGSTGTKTTTSDTSCIGGSCTTTTETRSSTPGGATVTAVDTKNESKDDYCEKNPRSPLCVDSTFGGACSSGFDCGGDAIQCAVAREVYSQNCKMNARTAQADLFDNEIVKAGNRTTDLPGNSTINLSSSSFDQSNALGVSAQCIQDITVYVMGNSVSLPFSRVCPFLEQLGLVLLGVSFILAARIVTRG